MGRRFFPTAPPAAGGTAGRSQVFVVAVEPQSDLVIDGIGLFLLDRLLPPPVEVPDEGTDGGGVVAPEFRNLKEGLADAAKVAGLAYIEAKPAGERFRDPGKLGSDDA